MAEPLTSHDLSGAPTLTVAAAQISSTPDPAANLELIGTAAALAADRGAQLVVAPEAAMACFGTRLIDVAQPLDGPFADGLRGVAQRHRIVVVAGMFTPGVDGRVRNTLLVTGAVEAHYDKIHLFDAFGSRESDTVTAGTELVTFEALGTRVGLATCYDLRFADQFTALGRAGAELILVPASWGDGPGKAEQWDLLVRSRAMDAQAFLLAADQSWTPARGSAPLGVGRSALIDPFGGVRARLGTGPDILVATVDLSQVAEIRAKVPILPR